MFIEYEYMFVFDIINFNNSRFEISKVQSGPMLYVEADRSWRF